MNKQKKKLDKKKLRRDCKYAVLTILPILLLISSCVINSLFWDNIISFGFISTAIILALFGIFVIVFSVYLFVEYFKSLMIVEEEKKENDLFI